MIRHALHVALYAPGAVRRFHGGDAAGELIHWATSRSARWRRSPAAAAVRRQARRLRYCAAMASVSNAGSKPAGDARNQRRFGGHGRLPWGRGGCRRSHRTQGVRASLETPFCQQTRCDARAPIRCCDDAVFDGPLGRGRCNATASVRARSLRSISASTRRPAPTALGHCGHALHWLRCARASRATAAAGAPSALRRAARARRSAAAPTGTMGTASGWSPPGPDQHVTTGDRLRRAAAAVARRGGWKRRRGISASRRSCRLASGGRARSVHSAATRIIRRPSLRTARTTRRRGVHRQRSRRSGKVGARAVPASRATHRSQKPHDGPTGISAARPRRGRWRRSRRERRAGFIGHAPGFFSQYGMSVWATGGAGRTSHGGGTAASRRTRGPRVPRRAATARGDSKDDETRPSQNRQGDGEKRRTARRARCGEHGRVR